MSSLPCFTAIWRAYGEGRLERSLHLIDPDCEVVVLGGRTFRGHGGLRRWLADVRGQWKSVTVTYERIHEPYDDCVVAVGRVAAVSLDDSETLDRVAACVCEFRDGRLVHARAFADAGDALRYARERHDPQSRAAAPSCN